MRYAPQMDSMHPDHRDEYGRPAPSLQQIARERSRVVLSDRSTWDWTSDGSCKDPYWTANASLAQRVFVRTAPAGYGNVVDMRAMFGYANRHVRRRQRDLDDCELND